MKKNTIPQFLHKIGVEIFNYIINGDFESVQDLSENYSNLNQQQQEIIQEFINLCRQIRIKNIDQSDIDALFSFYFADFIGDEKHQFNIWHEACGGIYPNILDDDPVLIALQEAAIEIYPLLIIENPNNLLGFTDISSVSGIYSFKNKKFIIARDSLINDPDIMTLFKNSKNADILDSFSYKSSNGRGSGIQLILFPGLIISNSFLLSKLKGDISISALFKNIAIVVGMIRDIAKNGTVNSFMFIGFNNVGFEEINSLDINWGIIKPYNKHLLNLIPHESRPSTASENHDLLGFFLESKFPYKIELNPLEEDIEKGWPKEMETVQQLITKVINDTSLLFALAIDRTPPIGIKNSWQLLFDPLCFGLNISWQNRSYYPMPFYVIKNHEVDDLKNWANLINENDSGGIDLAIRRIITALSERINPIDGFVDAVISWENLFGENAELGFRISVSISKLLSDDIKSRLSLQTEVNKLYDARSNIVHGSKVLEIADATRKRNRSIEISLQVLRKIFTDSPDLLQEKHRSKMLALK